MKITIERNYWKTKIPLSQGKFALVDRKNYDYLNQWKWHYAHGYAVRRIHKRLAKDKYAGTFIYMHRLIMNTPTGMDTDHINSNGLDNREKNLRVCTTRQNTRNRSKQSNNKSGYIGVHWNKNKQRWIAMTDDGLKKYTSHHIDVIEAAKARDALVIEHHGEYAKLNFPRSTV